MSTKTIAKEYYAVFKYSSNAVDVSFPDFPGCLTCGKNMEEAYEMAIDALAGWLECAEEEYIPKKRSTFKSVKEKFSECEVMLIPVDKSIMKEYEEKQRFNASFPKTVLNMVDSFVAKKGWNRSQFLIKAAEKYIMENGTLAED